MIHSTGFLIFFVGTSRLPQPFAASNGETTAWAPQENTNSSIIPSWSNDSPCVHGYDRDLYDHDPRYTVVKEETKQVSLWIECAPGCFSCSRPVFSHLFVPVPMGMLMGVVLSKRKIQNRLLDLKLIRHGFRYPLDHCSLFCSCVLRTSFLCPWSWAWWSSFLCPCSCAWWSSFSCPWSCPWSWSSVH